MFRRLIIILNSILFITFILIYFLFTRNIKSAIYKPVCNKCNVILISIDTLGSNHLPCYGYFRNTAPNLCKYADKNILFTNSFSNAGWTLPSTFSIFTSLYPRHHGIEAPGQILDKNIITLPQIFKQNGYYTEYVGTLDDPYTPIKGGIGRGFDKIGGYGIEDWDTALKKINKNTKKPFFIYLQSYWSHSPYVVGDIVPDGTKRMFTDKKFNDIPLTAEKYGTFTPQFFSFLKNYLLKTVDKQDYKNPQYLIFRQLRGSITFEEAEKIFGEILTEDEQHSYYDLYYMSLISGDAGRVEYAKALYDEMTFYLDQRLNQTLKTISEMERADNTVVIITSVHGEAFKEHGRTGHPIDLLYDEVLRVPLIIRVPGVKSKKITGLSQNIDLLPTLAGITGLKKPDKVLYEGTDLTDQIMGRYFPEINNYQISEGGDDTIRDLNYKLIVRYVNKDSKPVLELYDQKSDPGEKKNIASENPGIADRLLRQLNRIIYKK